MSPWSDRNRHRIKFDPIDPGIAVAIGIGTDVAAASVADHDDARHRATGREGVFISIAALGGLKPATARKYLADIGAGSGRNGRNAHACSGGI